MRRGLISRLVDRRGSRKRWRERCWICPEGNGEQDPGLKKRSDSCRGRSMSLHDASLRGGNKPEVVSPDSRGWRDQS